MKIFISYRRSDSQDIAARIADRLNDLPGVRKVFIDVGGIVPGVNFAARIAKAIEESDVCLILIGSNWIGCDSAGGLARTIDSEDFVHREVAASLTSGNRTIPIMLNDASMPSLDALPEDIRDLSYLNAEFIRHASFDNDIERLGDAIFSRQPSTPLIRFFRRHPMLSLFLNAIGGTVTMGALLLGLAAVHHEVTGGKALQQTLGSRGTVWLLILTLLVLGALVPLLFSRRP